MDQRPIHEPSSNGFIEVRLALGLRRRVSFNERAKSQTSKEEARAGLKT